MDALALGLLNRQNISIKDLIGAGKNQKTFDQVPLEQASPYAAEDADVTLQLAEMLHPQIAAMGLGDLYHGLELPLVEVLAELEYNGIKVDPDELDRQRLRLESEIAKLKSQIDEAALDALDRTFDLDSPKQLSATLFNKPDDQDLPGLGIKPVKKTKTGYSTDAEVLQKLTDDAAIESPIPSLILEYRQLAKLVSTYLVALKNEIHPETGRIHASFNQTVAATGRLSSSDPNLQNIPIRSEVGREIRRAFIADDGRVLITADYSQIELRLLAHLSRDPALIEAFQNDEDIHAAVAAQIHGVPLADVTREQRGGAKMVNFGIVYGITPFGLARRLGVSNTEADEIITGYKKRFAGITTFLEECVAQAKQHGYVETMLKRRRPIPDIDSNQPSRRSLAERMAINSVVQGSAADLIKLAMVDLHRRIHGLDRSSPAPAGEVARASGSEGVLASTRMLLQIHDELVFECPEPDAKPATAAIVERMEKAMDLSVPLKVEAGVSRNWFEGK
jgi:DNA polymerase-1